MTVDLAGAVALPGEKNRVRIVTWNNEGYLSSRGLDLDWEPPGRKEQQPIELHAIVVGVSNYDSDALKLRFAAKDAADVGKALGLRGKRLFGADKTHVTLLCDGGQPGAILPTRANLENAFEAARKCRPTDVLVVYLAGHGIALQEQGLCAAGAAAKKLIEHRDVLEPLGQFGAGERILAAQFRRKFTAT